MKFASSAVSIAFLIVALLSTLAVEAIKFDVVAETHPHTKCIWNYALSDTLVVITVNTIPKEPASFSDQRIDVEVVDGSKHNNVYLSKKNIKGETRLAINTHTHADLGVCFKNTLIGRSAGIIAMTVDLDVDIGADAVDYNAIANQESLSGLETEMRKLESVANEIMNEMDYLKKRELRMRDTNMSTNMRVSNFAILTILALVVLGTWQVFHLRGFFKRKYLID
ncbi:endoplasmic reticulum vesicle protein 25 [Testicularia cyperi]|uniref:Endoplasmic reticulum vesicle protein 25 n=1 Tax=Testicularia cyperi TaxID=1882483 RepID=A0A317XR19_9BASI|nr:endoplasmic reticulum vesicle protein 25 [Testicularia cyperi]